MNGQPCWNPIMILTDGVQGFALSSGVEGPTKQSFALRTGCRPASSICQNHCGEVLGVSCLSGRLADKMGVLTTSADRLSIRRMSSLKAS